MLTHNSTLAKKTEPAWGSIDKASLPRNAFADMGIPEEISTFRYPHHFVKNGDMFLHKGGLKVALQAAGGIRSGKKEESLAIKKHLSHHANVIGMSEKETAVLLGISTDMLKTLLDDNNNNNESSTTTITKEEKEKEKKGKGGGVNLMSKTYEELEADVKALEISLTGKDTVITAMKTDAETVATSVKSLESEIAKYEESESELQDKVDNLEKNAKDDAIFITAGKQFIEDTKAEIHKMSVQVDGNDYNKDLVDKQLVAFGIDLEALNAFKANLENRRTKLLKTGGVDPDEQKSEQTTAQEEYALGQAIGTGNVIPIIKKAN
jgi:chromosome segregation ATPase